MLSPEPCQNQGLCLIYSINPLDRHYCKVQGRSWAACSWVPLNTTVLYMLLLCVSPCYPFFWSCELEEVNGTVYTSLISWSHNWFFFLQETPTLLPSAIFIEMHLSLPVLSRWMNLPPLSCGDKSLAQNWTVQRLKDEQEIKRILNIFQSVILPHTFLESTITHKTKYTCFTQILQSSYLFFLCSIIFEWIF